MRNIIAILFLTYVDELLCSSVSQSDFAYYIDKYFVF